MRILFIVPYVPTQIRVRPYNLLRTLRDRGHQVTLATLWTSDAERAELERLKSSSLNVLAARLSRSRALSNCLTVLPAKTPLQAAYCRHPDLLQALRALLRTESFDIIHVEHLRGVDYGLALKSEGIPIVWDSVDCISYLFEQAANHSHSRFGKWISRLELERTRRFEGWLLDQFPAVLVTSTIDKEALVRLAANLHPETERAHPDRIRVLSNGVDQRYFSPREGRIEPDTLVFSGKMSYHANVTMAMNLVRHILPVVWAERPGAKLTIVGQKPPASVRQLGKDPRVTVTGYVPDIRPYLQQATVAVVPSVYGAGIQNKVLEAMACGTPVVATERAIAALSLIPEQDILVANDTEGFAHQVLRLLGSPELCQTIGANGRDYVKKHHDWSQIGAKLEAIYEAVKTSEVSCTENSDVIL
jgi:sugar transferase (PEP-CTERM/EpsH1 system associated)